MDFGNFIKQKRQQLGISGRELARRSDISQSYLSQLETGKNNKPAHDIMKRLSEGLNVDISDLYEVSGHYIDAMLDQIEGNAKKRFKEGTENAQDFNFNEFDYVTKRLKLALDYKKEIYKDNDDLSKEDAKFLHDLYKQINKINPNEFDSDQQERIKEMMAILLKK